MYLQIFIILILRTKTLPEKKEFHDYNKQKQTKNFSIMFGIHSVFYLIKNIRKKIFWYFVYFSIIIYTHEKYRIHPNYQIHVLSILKNRFSWSFKHSLMWKYLDISKLWAFHKENIYTELWWGHKTQYCYPDKTLEVFMSMSLTPKHHHYRP